MSDVLNEIETKLSEFEKQIEAAANRLNAMATVEEQLRAVSGGLSSSSESLGQLTSSLDETIGEFRLALAAFRDASETVRKTDPARTLEALGNLQTRLKTTSKQIDDTKEFLSGRLQSIEDATLREQEDANTTLLKALGDLKANLEARTAKTSRELTLLIIVVGLIAAASLALELFQQFGVPTN